MVRLKDIAQHVGVSVMTVSKALRDEPDVSAATKARIKALAQQMGYVPDSSAQGLRTKTTKLFGLVIPSITNPIYARIVFAIEERAHELGYDILLAHTLNMPEREEPCIRRLLSRRVDGLFISPVYRFEAEARIYQEAARAQNADGPARPARAVLQTVSQRGNRGTHRQLQRHATSVETRPQTHRLFHRPASRRRGRMNALKAIAARCAKPDLDVDDKLVFQAGSTIEDGTKAALQMLNESCNATAVQAVSDLVAIGCAETLLVPGPENSRGHFHRRLRQHSDGGIFSRAADDHPPAEIPARHRRHGHDDQPAARRAGGIQASDRRTHRTQKHRAAQSRRRAEKSGIDAVSFNAPTGSGQWWSRNRQPVKSQLNEDDILTVEVGFSEDMLNNLKYEIRDVFPNNPEILNRFVRQDMTFSHDDLWLILAESGVPEAQVDDVLDVLLWFSFLGVLYQQEEHYAYQVLYNLPKLKSLISRETGSVNFIVHPVFRASLKSG